MEKFLSIQERETYTEIADYLVRMALPKTKTKTHIKCWWGVGQRRRAHCCWEQKYALQLWTSGWSFLQNKNPNDHIIQLCYSWGQTQEDVSQCNTEIPTRPCFPQYSSVQPSYGICLGASQQVNA